MKKLTYSIFAFSILFASCDKSIITDPITSEPDSNIVDDLLTIEDISIDGHFIVTLQPNFASLPLGLASNFEERNAILKAEVEAALSLAGLAEVEIGATYNTVFIGFSAKLTPSQKNLLSALPIVALIESDKMVFPLGSHDGKSTTAGQEIPYGIDRVGKASGAGKRAWIIDSGVDLTHPDLNVNSSLSKSFLSPGFLSFLFADNNSSPNDENGHGTHVAGTVAAKDNGTGVIGVAYDAEVVAVRVLDANGSGATSGVIEGVDYVAAKASVGDVANMSLGGGVSTSLDNAVKAAASKGIYFALAAGNESTDANSSSPGRANGPNIFTISAMDSNDKFASFSNYGSPVDFCAPGVSTKSTYKNGGYATLSGTSMATPHVAGLLLITNGNLSIDGYVSNDRDNNPDPIAHK